MLLTEYVHEKRDVLVEACLQQVLPSLNQWACSIILFYNTVYKNVSTSAINHFFCSWGRSLCYYVNLLLPNLAATNAEFSNTILNTEGVILREFF